MKSKKKGMDVSNIHSSRCRHLTPPFQYNADIPFEKKAAPGFYDTSEEQARASIAPVGQSLRRLENKRKPGEEEEAERKKRQRNNKDENAHQTKLWLLGTLKSRS